MKTGILQPESESAAVAAARMMNQSKQSVKLETVDEYQQYARDKKRSKVSSDSRQWRMVESIYPVQTQQYHPLDVPSPLGLKLKKSPSLVELIQTHLAQNIGTVKPAISSDTISSDQSESKSPACINDKLKASNIPASLLKIGNWEYMSRHEGDLVVKCYFAKHKLVWEVLESGLKSKIEIQWSDITGLKADCPEIGESSLKLVLAKQPLFFRETNPQPRKHTLWQPCSDFTDGEATLNRLHFLKFPQRTLQKHYEKLIQSDSRLHLLSRQPDIAVNQPHFEGGQSSILESDSKSHFVDPIKAGELALSADYPDVYTTIQPSFFKIEQQGYGGIMSERPPSGSFSSNSGMAVQPIEEFQAAGRKRSIDQFKEPAGHNTSKLDVMNCLANMIPSDSDIQAVQNKDQLENLADYLLNDIDSNITLPTDEKSVMARVNSLCSLLLKDTVEGSNSLMENHRDTFINNKENLQGVIFNSKSSVFDSICASSRWEEPAENSSMKPATGMMKKDSFSDLLLHFPHITSLPKFMNFSEDNVSHFS